MLGRRAGDAALDKPQSANLVVSLPDVIALAKRHGRSDDPFVRQKLAQLHTYVETGRWNAQRSKAEAARGGGESLTSIGKIAQTRIMKLAAEVGIDILGVDGTLAGDDGTDGGKFAEAFVFAPASSIYGGTDEIQRNIIAERTLGLPRDERPDKGVPFSQVPR
jgi:alkylation response protein AidB-like acyl-CoA dehydrogenase